MAQRRFVTHPIVLRELTVAGVIDVTPRMRRVTLTEDQLAGFHRDGLDLAGFVSTGFDDHVKLLFAAEGDVRDLLPVQLAHAIEWGDKQDLEVRDYTVRAVDPHTGAVDLDFVLHGDGPAASWAQQAQIGETVHLVGPKSSIRLPENLNRIVLAGDETALPAIARFLDERPTSAPAQLVIEVHNESARQQLALGPNDTLEWVRDGELVSAVMALPWPDDEVFVWAAAESRALLPLRGWLSREKQVPKTHVDITGYWHADAQAADAAAGEHDDDVFARVLATAGDASLATVLARDPEAYRAWLEQVAGFVFIAPALTPHLGHAARIVSTGPGSVALAEVVSGREFAVVEARAGQTVLADELPGVGVTDEFSLADLVVAARALAYRSDAEAIDLLTCMRGVTTRGWIVEETEADDHAHHDDHGHTLFGRTADELVALAEASGWVAADPVLLGWHHVLIELSPLTATSVDQRDSGDRKA